jgi:hypothetical protein
MCTHSRKRMRILLCAHARTLVCCALTARVSYLRCLSVDSIVRVAVFDPLHSQVNPNIHVEVFIHKVRTNPQSAQLLCDPMQLPAWLHALPTSEWSARKAPRRVSVVFAPHRSTGCRTTRRLSISRTLRRSAVPCRAVPCRAVPCVVQCCRTALSLHCAVAVPWPMSSTYVSCTTVCRSV